MERKTALIAGATGLVGRALLDVLLSDDHYDSVSVLVRRTLDMDHNKLSQHVVDFDKLDHSEGLIAADDVFCCLGTTLQKAGSREAFYRVDFTYPLALANVALQSGASQFILVSALGASKTAPSVYYRVKGEIEETIGQLEFKTVIVIRPSLLLGERDEQRIGESIAKAVLRCFGFALVGPLRQYQPVAATTVATSMAAIARKGLHGVHTFSSEQCGEQQ